MNHKNNDWFCEERLKKQPYDNNKTIELLQQDTEWARIVKDRIIRCKFKFNKWIDHPVINYIKTLY